MNDWSFVFNPLNIMASDIVLRFINSGITATLSLKHKELVGKKFPHYILR